MVPETSLTAADERSKFLSESYCAACARKVAMHRPLCFARNNSSRSTVAEKLCMNELRAHMDDKPGATDYKADRMQFNSQVLLRFPGEGDAACDGVCSSVPQPTETSEVPAVGTNCPAACIHAPRLRWIVSPGARTWLRDMWSCICYTAEQPCPSRVLITMLLTRLLKPPSAPPSSSRTAPQVRASATAAETERAAAVRVETTRRITQVRRSLLRLR